MYILLGTKRDLVTSVRVRVLNKWSVHNWGDGEYSVEGFVINGNEPGDEDDEIVRRTRTSPIVGRRGPNIVITSSGSQYTLADPANHQDPQQLLELFPEL